MNESKQLQRKAQILDAALAVIVQKGYENSRMDDIVASSKMSKGAIYWYYKSKKEIYLSLVNHWVHNYSAVLNHIVDTDRSASDQLRSLFQYFTVQYEKDPVVFKALLEFWSMAGRDPEFNDKLQKVYSEFVNLISTIIQQGMDNGEFKNLDVDITAMSIMVNIEGIMWFTLFKLKNTSAREYIQTISDFILSGLIKK
ncbi:MAG TPA: TetR/AcrR family transcriptional regulator [Candidatus Marinimicrobia bacterium]|jgi:AcrR family transcriptional regulator|nr:TetR/AcrR family transcriptional regulator [Candidatus Neomarinimicrobiota bacterium]HIM73425.1 TetR/AcrR family transcriptional regulator [Candidatus Neomarinimicrobiota bacterium]